MKIDDLKQIGRAPQKGSHLLYTRKKVLFGEYHSLDEFRSGLEGEELLEVHLFDDTSEYRAITTESPRYPDGVIEWVADFEDDGMNVYKETCLLENNGKLTVLNHISYDPDNGMASIDDYRLVRG